MWLRCTLSHSLLHYVSMVIGLIFGLPPAAFPALLFSLLTLDIYMSLVRYILNLLVYMSC